MRTAPTSIALVISVALLSGCGAGSTTPGPIASHAVGPGAPITRVALVEAGPARGAKPLHAVPLLGPYASESEVCSRFGELMEARLGWPGTTCIRLPFSMRQGGPFADAQVMVVANTPAPEPSLRGKGASFFAVRAGGEWFSTAEPLDTVSSGAGHTFIPVVTPVHAEIVEPRGKPPRVLLRAKDVIDQTCNVCEPPYLGKPMHVRTRDVVLVCSTNARGVPVCTPPIELHPDAKVSLSTSDVLTFDQPINGDDGSDLALHGTYAITF